MGNNLIKLFWGTGMYSFLSTHTKIAMIIDMAHLILPIWPNWNSTEPKGLFWSPSCYNMASDQKGRTWSLYKSCTWTHTSTLVHELEFLIFGEFFIPQKVDLFNLCFLSGRKKSFLFCQKGFKNSIFRSGFWPFQKGCIGDSDGYWWPI